VELYQRSGASFTWKRNGGVDQIHPVYACLWVKGPAKRCPVGPWPPQRPPKAANMRETQSSQRSGEPGTAVRGKKEVE